MIRRLFVAILTAQMALLSIICLFLAILLVYCAVSGNPAWKIYGIVLGFALMMGGVWYLLHGEIAGADGHGRDAVRLPRSAQPESQPQTLWSKVPGVNPIRRFVQWFWRISGLDDVKRPLWQTPFGGWFAVFLSSPLLIASLVMFIHSELFVYRSVSTEGSVINLVADHDETVHYAPVFAFTAQDGRNFSVQSNTYSAPPEFRVGQRVSVLYEEGHPEQARIATYEQVHSLELVFGLIGIFFAGIGFGSLLYQRRRNRHASSSLAAS